MSTLRAAEGGGVAAPSRRAAAPARPPVASRGSASPTPTGRAAARGPRARVLDPGRRAGRPRRRPRRLRGPRPRPRRPRPAARARRRQRGPLRRHRAPRTPSPPPATSATGWRRAGRLGRARRPALPPPPPLDGRPGAAHPGRRRPPRGAPARGRRRAETRPPAASVGTDGRDALRVAYRSPAARPRRARPRRRPGGRRRRSRGRAGRPRRRGAGGGARRSRAPRLPAAARALPARGHRHGQVRRPRAQLRERRRRGLRRRAAARRDEAEALRTATLLANGLVRVCGTTDDRGDAVAGRRGAAARGQGRAARPHARRPPRRTTERWAKTWEFQALLKARPVAGDIALGGRTSTRSRRSFLSAATRDNFVEDVQAMRRRVEAHVRPERERQIKLGPGGLRDIEFAVQLLQLVHGRLTRCSAAAPPCPRWPPSRVATWAARTRAGWRRLPFLRQVEHRLQLHRLRRTHVLPTGDADLRSLGRALGMHGDPVGELHLTLATAGHGGAAAAREALLPAAAQAVARLPDDQARLTPAAAPPPRALGYLDPDGALRHLEARSTGVSRRDPADAAAGHARLVRRRRTPTRDCSASARSATRSAPRRGTCGCCDETRWRIGWPACSGPAATPPSCCSRRAGGGRHSRQRPRTRAVRPRRARARSPAPRPPDGSAAAVAAVRAVRRRELFASRSRTGPVDIERVGVGLSADACDPGRPRRRHPPDGERHGRCRPGSR